VWLDVFVPNEDVLAESDVGKSFHWLGDVFAEAIATVLGTFAADARIEVKSRPVQATPWSTSLCYAGLGAGEVTVAGRKVVGMSQRRERSGAWIHSMALLSHRTGTWPICWPAQPNAVRPRVPRSRMPGSATPNISSIL